MFHHCFASMAAPAQTRPMPSRGLRFLSTYTLYSTSLCRLHIGAFCMHMCPFYRCCASHDPVSGFHQSVYKAPKQAFFLYNHFTVIDCMERHDFVFRIDPCSLFCMHILNSLSKPAIERLPAAQGSIGEPRALPIRQQTEQSAGREFQLQIELLL